MRLGVFVGHSREGDEGAQSVGGITEWQYNAVVADMMVDKLEGVLDFVQEFNDYPASSYGAAMDWVREACLEHQLTHAIELHFNAATPSANGHEFLYWHTSKEGLDMAQAFRMAMLEDWPHARDRGVKSKDGTDRGAGFLSKTPCPAVILEPFFGSNSEDWQRFGGNHLALATTYAKAVLTIAGEKEEDIPPDPPSKIEVDVGELELALAHQEKAASIIKGLLDS